ncbi:traB domain-containing protein isoform X2 [Nomia melanderi]|uniref:traB domain-containing protein isoform X2 n=1 Tax=Nomia melanderi TaxID=2448451 RepID=UPI003FCD0FE1
MSSNVKNFDNSNSNVSQHQISVENKQYSVVNQKDDFNARSKSGMQNMSEKLIANESGIYIDPTYESENESSTMETSVDIKEKKAEENSESGVSSNVQSKNDLKKHDIIGSNQNEYDASIDERLPETVELLTTPYGAKLYLVGTAHFSIESQNDVSMIIQAVQPHIIVVELCIARAEIMQLNEEVIYQYAKDLSFQSITELLSKYGFYNGLLYVLLLRMVAYISKQLGVAPGGEFRRAFEEAKKIPDCIIQLADRPINITIQRAIRSLTWWETLKLGWHLVHLKGDINQEVVEVCKQKNLLDNIVHDLKESFPAMEKVFVEERDLYLTHSLQLACMLHPTSNGVVAPRVVGIVGIGHISGILKNWGKVKPSDIPPIMRVPPQPLSSKILKFTVKISLLSAVIYVGYKILPLPSGITLQYLRSSVEGLLKLW